MLLKSKIYSGKRRGRPKGTILKKPETKATKQMRLSQELWDWLQPHTRKNETYSETLVRLLIKGQKNEEALAFELAFTHDKLLECQRRVLNERRNNFNREVEVHPQIVK